MAFHVLILAGGTGTRLWPLSRRSTPKHLLPLAPGGRTLLRDTVERVVSITDSVHVVTAADQAELCRAELAGLAAGIIAEPEARGTGPALWLATRKIARDDPGAVIMSVHADAYIGDVDAYRAAVVCAAGWCRATNGFAAVGIAPTYPATGFGYIAVGAPRAAADWVAPGAGGSGVARSGGDGPAFAALGFVEKPDAATAQRFLTDGSHLWNSGLFGWTAQAFEAEAGAANPGLGDAVAQVVEAQEGGDEHRAAEIYSQVEKIPVEPLVFERTKNLTVVKASFPWSDVGSWADLHDVRVESGDADGNGNVVDGAALLLDAKNCMVSSRGGRTVAVAELENIVVVDTGDAVLVIPADKAQRVKEIAEGLAESNPDLV
jgi:mannose-1-phosphate guanylyltransferase/mannose-6-phosphate isomerase